MSQSSSGFTRASHLQTGVNGNLGADLTSLELNTWALTGANSYTGGTSVSGGTLRVAGVGTDAGTGAASPHDSDDAIMLGSTGGDRTTSAPSAPKLGQHEYFAAFRLGQQTESVAEGEQKPQSGVGKDSHSPGNADKASVELGVVLAPTDAEKKDKDQKDTSGPQADNGRDASVPIPTKPEATAPATPSPEQQAIAIQRKIIRNGEVTFEVDSFDSSFVTIAKLVTEDGGFVASTDSAKLGNGKMRGTIVVRIPPDRLDLFILKLRGLGDLKAQQIKANDVTKQYTDTESSLRAARAMEERLLKIIKDGTGQVKDLLAAEKELGTWREKIETLEGEKRYYDNLVAMSTLSITLQERDIRAAGSAIECERVNAGIETEDVEKSRAEVLKSIDDAKGRVISADLKKLDAGQFAANIVAEVPPENAGPVIDRLRQVGKVTRMDVDRKQTTVDGSSAPLPGAKIEKRPTTLTVNLYNLANVAPRQSSTLTVAATNVEAVYHDIQERVSATPGARIVASNLSRPKPDQPAATLRFETKSADADNVLADLKSRGEVMNLVLTENPDTANSTLAKRGFELQLVSLAAVPARQTITQQLVVSSVSEAHAKLQEIAQKLNGTVLVSDLREGRRDQTMSTLELDIPVIRQSKSTTQDVSHNTTPAQWWDNALASTGDSISRVVARSSDTQNTVDTKIHYVLTLFALESVPPRQSTLAMVTVSSAENAAGQLAALVSQLNGRVRASNLNKDSSGRSVTSLTVDIPYSQHSTFLGNLRGMGELASFETVTNPNIPDGALAQSRFQLTLSESPALVSKDQGLLASLREGFSTSLRGLGYSLQLVIVGLCLAGPWALIAWAGYRFFKRRSAKPARQV